MRKRLSKLVEVTTLALMMLTFLVSSPASAQCGPRAGECLAPPYAVAAEPVWGTLNATPGENYPGGSLQFDVFVINSGVPPDGNVTLYNETITSPQLPASLNTSTAAGLPVLLDLGQAITSTITMQIPHNFTLSNFTASLVADVSYWNGTFNIPIKLTGGAIVYMLGDPLAGTTTTTSLTTSSATHASTQSGVSMTLLAAGVAIPSVVAVMLLVLVARGRGGPKSGT